MIDTAHSPIPKRVPTLFGVFALILGVMGVISAMSGWAELLTFVLMYGWFILGAIAGVLYFVRKQISHSVNIIEGKESR